MTEIQDAQDALETAKATMQEALREATEGLAMVKDIAQMILGSASGHRAQAIAQGFSEGAAEQMAVTYHQIVLVKIFNPNPQVG